MKGNPGDAWLSFTGSGIVAGYMDSSLRCHLTQGLDYTTDTVDRSPRWPCSYCGHSVAGHRDDCDNCGGPREDRT